MKNFIKKHCDCFILCLMVLVFAVIACFGLGNTSAPSTFYQTGELEDGTHYNSLCYEIDYSNKEYTLDSVWINFGSPDYTKDYQNNTEERIEFFTSMASSRSSSFNSVDCFTDDYYSEEVLEGAIKNTVSDFKVGQWRLLCKDVSYKSYAYFLISTKSAVKINEIAFVGVDSNGTKTLLSVKSFGAGEKNAYKGSGSSLDNSSEFGINLSAVELADKLIDEQDKFDVSNITDAYVYNQNGNSVFTETEAYTIESVRNLVSGRSNFTDKSVMPLGQYLIAIGTAVFGYTTLGVRIIPMLFGLGIIVLAFFLGKLLFGKSLYALVLSGLTAFGGLLLSISTLGTADVMLAFFVTLSFTLTLRFYKKGISNAHFTKDVLSLLCAGISFAVAFVIKSTAIYYLVAIAFVFVLGMIRQNKAYKFRLTRANDEKEEKILASDYTRKATVSGVICFSGFILCTIIFSVVFALIGYKTYCGVYQNTNVISYGMSLIKDGFSVINPTSLDTVNSSSFWGYAVNHGAQAFGQNKYAFGSIISAFLSFFALVFCFVYFITEKLDKTKSTDINSKNLYLNYAFVAVAAIAGYVLTGLTANSGFAGYLLPTLFMYCVTVSAFAILDKEDKKTVFKIKSAEFTLSRIVASVLGLAILVSFALAVPAFIGISANTGLFSWNLLTHTAFVG